METLTQHLRLILTALLLLVGCSLQAQSSQEGIVKKATIYFSFDKSSVVELNNSDAAHEFIEWAKQDTLPHIYITGWSDTTGPAHYNYELALQRAKTVRRYFEINGIALDRMTALSEGEDTLATTPNKARRVEIVAQLTPEQSLNTPKATTPSAPAVEATEPSAPATEATQPSEATASTTQATEATEATEATDSPTLTTSSDPSELSIRTNLLYWVGGVANAGLEWEPANSRIGLLVNGGIGLLTSPSWEKRLGGWFVAPEMRIYLGERQAWFVGAQFITGEYDIKRGKGRDGSVNAGGLTAGYKLALSKGMDMDFSLGAGYGTLKYDCYRLNSQGNRVYSSRGNTLTRFLPIQAGVSLIWKL